MSKIVIFGATGFTGQNIAKEAVIRGHQVVGIARNIEGKNLEGVSYVQGDLTDAHSFAHVTRDADVVVLAVRHSHPRVAELVSSFAKVLEGTNTRLGVVGGAGSLFGVEGGPRVFESPDFPEAYKVEAHAAFDTLNELKEQAELDWFYLSPPALYGSFNPGVRTGDYRLGAEVLLSDENGKSFISGEDYAIAFVDEIDMNRHSKQRFTVGY